MLVNAIYNIVDRMFIGNAPHLGSISELAELPVSYPLTFNINGTKFNVCCREEQLVFQLV